MILFDPITNIIQVYITVTKAIICLRASNVTLKGVGEINGAEPQQNTTNGKPYVYVFVY